MSNAPVRLPARIDLTILAIPERQGFTISEPTHAKADLIPYSPEYAGTVRSWIDSEKTYYYVCRGKEFPPPDEVVDSWQRTGVQAFILFANNKPIAYGELWDRKVERAMEIAHVIVDPVHRGEGYGTKIIELLFDRGSSRVGITKVLINLYNDSEAALGCYLKAGFELSGTATYTTGLKMIRLVER